MMKMHGVADDYCTQTCKLICHYTTCCSIATNEDETPEEN